jgi:Holliday junction DNA helicase RuvA
MYSYIYGKVIEIGSTYVTVDNNGIGYAIATPNPYVFHEGEFYTIYIYQHIREDELSLYGFKSKEEKDLFLKLIDVKG